MIHKILNKIIISLGKTDYKIDKNINSIDLMKIILLKSIQFIRSLPLYFQVKKAKGIIFLGKKVDIKFKSKLILGRSIFIGDYVEINCLSKNGVIVGNNFSIHKNSTIESLTANSNLSPQCPANAISRTEAIRPPSDLSW